jgi:hypothetical protein
MRASSRQARPHLLAAGHITLATPPLTTHFFPAFHKGARLPSLATFVPRRRPLAIGGESRMNLEGGAGAWPRSHRVGRAGGDRPACGVLCARQEGASRGRSWGIRIGAQRQTGPGGCGGVKQGKDSCPALVGMLASTRPGSCYHRPRASPRPVNGGAGSP